MGRAVRGALAPLSVLLDTNIVIRHLTGDPPELANRATRFLDSAERLDVTDVVLAECAFVLESFYRRPRDEVGRLLTALLDLPAVRVADRDVLDRCLAIYGAGAALPDAYLVATAEAHGATIASFDRGIDRIETEIRRREP